MGNLTLTAGVEPDFRKGVISLWFRIPEATRAVVAARTDPSIEQYDPFLKVLPLLTWGPQVEQQTTTKSSENVDYANPCVGEPTTFSESVDSAALGTSQFAGPSYIGVRCWGPGELSEVGGEMTLEVNIQTAIHPVCVGTYSLITDYVWTPPEVGCASPDPWCDCLGVAFVAVDTDASNLDERMLEFFGNRPDVARGGATDWGGPSGNPLISGTDQWHHLILSWDTTNGCSVTGWDSIADPGGDTQGFTSLGVVASSSMWCSIDDVNKSGADLPAMWPYYDGGVAGDANAMLSYTPMGVSSYADQIDGSPSTASVSVSAIAFSPFSIPSALSVTQTTGGTVVPNLRADTALLQVFAGVTADTGNELIRRLFITSEGQPAAATLAEAEFGQAPVIRLDTSTDWITGNNLGTGGNFVPIGTITAYNPGPGG